MVRIVQISCFIQFIFLLERVVYELTLNEFFGISADLTIRRRKPSIESDLLTVK